MPAAPVDAAVAAIRAGLGLGAEPGPVGARYGFEAGSVSIEVTATPDGRRALARGRLGWLAPTAAQADDQLRRVLRLSLALAPSNAAVVTPDAGLPPDAFARLASGDPAPPLPIDVVADCGPAGEQAMAALGDILHWAQLAEPILLGAAPAPQASAAPPPASAVDEMMIFRP
ncbi:MAG: hypothetical protein ACU0BF_00795 [Paracoccaceae bacterium]